MKILVNNFFKNNYFILIILLYCAIQVLQRMLLSPTLSVDEAEQLILSQTLSLGYNEQPPLYTWLQILFFYMFGTSVLSVSLLKNLFLGVTFIYFYKLSRLILNDEYKSIVATLGLLFLPQIFWEAKVDQTHSVLVTMASVATLYSIVRIYREDGSSIRYAVLGGVCAVGILAKYNFVLVVLGLLCAVVLIHEFRCKIINKKLWIALLSFFIIIAPHFFWFLFHVPVATESTLERIHYSGLLGPAYGAMNGILDLFISALTFNALLLVTWGYFFKAGIRANKNNFSKFFLYFYIFIFVSLILIVFKLNITNIKERWLLPYLIFIPIILTNFVRAETIQATMKRFCLCCFLLTFGTSCLYLLAPRFIDLTRHASKINIPFITLQRSVQDIIAHSNNALLVTDNYFLGGNFRLLFPEQTIFTKFAFSSDTLAKDILVFYDKNAPDFLSKINGLNYRCESGEVTAHYVYSESMEYTLKYQHCMPPRQV